MSTPVRFWLDPLLPVLLDDLAWLRSVAVERDLDISWQPISLLVKNDTQPDSPWYAMSKWSFGLLRCSSSCGPRRANRRWATCTWSTAAGSTTTVRGSGPWSRRSRAVGLPEDYAAAFDDDTLDDDVLLRHHEAIDLVGDDVGTPIIGIPGRDGDEVGLFGPMCRRGRRTTTRSLCGTPPCCSPGCPSSTSSSARATAARIRANGPSPTRQTATASRRAASTTSASTVTVPASMAASQVGAHVGLPELVEVCGRGRHRVDRGVGGELAGDLVGHAHQRAEAMLGMVDLDRGRRAPGRHLHGGHLVLGAVGGPVGVLGGDHVGAADRVVEGGVHHALGIRSETSACSVVAPTRLASVTSSPSRMPRSSASAGWISSTSSPCQRTLSVRRSARRRCTG